MAALNYKHCLNGCSKLKRCLNGCILLITMPWWLQLTTNNALMAAKYHWTINLCGESLLDWGTCYPTYVGSIIQMSHILGLIIFKVPACKSCWGRDLSCDLLQIETFNYVSSTGWWSLTTYRARPSQTSQGCWISRVKKSANWIQHT